ncbi:MAG: LysR family transcriptional regulator [Pseudomonadota bacterium]
MIIFLYYIKRNLIIDFMSAIQGMTRVSIRALRTLIAIHRHGSFRAAAEAENLTPAAVSQQMRSLEDTWQLDLFERSTRTPKLTETGLALVGEATNVVAAYDGLASKVSARDELSGELILGAVPTTLTGLMPLALSKLKVQHPGIRVRIVPGLSNQLLLQLDRGQVHAAIISRPDVLPANLSFATIATEELVLLVGEGTKGDTPEKLLRSQPFIRFNRDAVVGMQIEAWLQSKDIVVNDAMELEGLEAISSMVAGDLGISIVPQRCIHNDDHLPLRTISLGLDAPRRTLGLVSHRNSPRAKIIRIAEEACRGAISNR